MEIDLDSAKELDEVIKRSFSLLGKILNESIASKDDENLQASFIHRHANNIFCLGQDAIYLFESGRSYSCPAIVRVMLESLFKLVAAAKTAKTTIEIIISELEHDSEKIAKWLDPSIYGPISSDFLDQAQKLRKTHDITSVKKWTTLECAKAAQLDDGHYHDAYFHLSSHSHATILGIEIQDKTASAGYVLQILIYIILSAAVYTVSTVPTNSPQEHALECKKLGDKWMLLMDAGVFSKMDEL